jgi:hypothetical protein
MAGGAQGGGGRPAVGGNMQQFQNALQNYRQGSAGMPSQVPGANVAAPGGMQQGMTGRAPMPQGFMNAPNGPGAPQMPQGMARPMPMPGPVDPYTGVVAPPPQMPQGQGLINPDPAQVQAMFQQAQAQQGMNVGAYQPQISQPLPPAAPQPQPSQPLPQAQPMPRPMPRPTPQGMPQVMGNPNAMPLQRPQFRGRR